jgi:hypothetical protein
MRKWTQETALAHIKKVIDGKLPKGLTYWSAYDYLTNHCKAVLSS